VPLVQDVVMDPNGAAKAALSASGTLVYRSGKLEALAMLVHGAVTALPMSPRNFSTPRFSPDGKRIAFTISSASSIDVWVYDLAHATLTKITSEGGSRRPEWTADGKRLVFISEHAGQNGIWWQPADGSGAAELLYLPPEGDPYEALLSPDGKWLVYRTGPAARPARSIFMTRVGGDGKSILLVGGGSYIQMPKLSPDGHWLAYQSNETGTFEVYARPFPDAGGRVQLSSGGGIEPVWAHSGRMLYYRVGGDVMGIATTLGASLGLGERKVMFTGDYMTNPSHPNYDVSPDGSQFLMLRRAGEEVVTVVVHNWAREVAEKTAMRQEP